MLNKVSLIVKRQYKYTLNIRVEGIFLLMGNLNQGKEEDMKSAEEHIGANLNVYLSIVDVSPKIHMGNFLRNFESKRSRDLDSQTCVLFGS